MAGPNQIDSGSRRAWRAVGAWVTVYIAVVAAYRWLTAPVGPITSLPVGAVFVLIVALDGWLATPAGAGHVNPPSAPEAEVWMTARAVRLKRCLPTLLVAALLVDLIRTTLALWAIHDVGRTVAAIGLGAALSGLAALRLWRARRSVVELRIDAAGIFTPKWKTSVGWDKVDYVVQPGAREPVLRLMVGPDAATGLSPSLRANGGFLRLPLDRAGLSARDAMAAIRKAHPATRVEPFNSNGFVLAIKGAADAPETVQVANGS